MTVLLTRVLTGIYILTPECWILKVLPIVLIIALTGVLTGLDWNIDWSVGWRKDWNIDWSIYKIVYWSVDWRIDWNIDSEVLNGGLTGKYCLECWPEQPFPVYTLQAILQSTLQSTVTLQSILHNTWCMLFHIICVFSYWAIYGLYL